MPGRIEPDSREARYANVILDSTSRQLDRPFTYEVPSSLEGAVEVGSVVLVPFLRALHLGYVLEFCDRPDLARIRPLETVVDEPPVFDTRMVELCRWMASHYVSPLSQAVRLLMPPGRVRRVMEIIELREDPDMALAKTGAKTVRERLLIEMLAAKGGSVPLRELKSELGDWVAAAVRGIQGRGSIGRRFVLAKPKASSLKVRLLEITGLGRQALLEDAMEKKSPARHRLLQALRDNGGQMSAPELSGLRLASASSVKAAIDMGLVRERYEVRLRHPFADRSFQYQEPHALNPEQQVALNTVTREMESGRASVCLLHGVTGSGKTEIYLRAIDHTLRKGRSALVLVPEIALTPQMVERFKARLGQEVAVLHSKLGLGERYDQWRGIREGRHRVVIGARSALFAPLLDLGLVIIDEEHETTYKEGSSPRYNAGDVAVKRAQLNNAVVIFGSATPSLESRFLADRGDYVHLHLPRRIDNRPLPKAETVDMREPSDAGRRSIISPQLANALAGIYKAGEQAILFLNRRGFARFLQCQGCGHIFGCPNCAVSLCYHSREAFLLCHHCDWRLLPPFICPQCGKGEHRYTGVGTERVEAELKRLLPSLNSIRMDADTTRRKDSHWDILEYFKAGKAQVLLGTQMIAKGLDIPSVTLVGIINADTSLGLPDFRAGERTFQLLTQVSGRAGRGPRHGRVIVQTSNPDHYAIQSAIAGDEHAFYEQEIEFRREANYPPFCRLVNIVIAAGAEEDSVQASNFLRDILEEKISVGKGDIELLGPAPAPLSRLKGKFRYHLTLKTPSLEPLAPQLEDCLSAYESFRVPYCRKRGIAKETISLIVDVDPVSLL